MKNNDTPKEIYLVPYSQETSLEIYVGDELPDVNTFLTKCSGPNGSKYFKEVILRNGIDQSFPFDPAELRNLEQEYERAKKSDEQTKAAQVAEEYKRYKASLPRKTRWFSREKSLRKGFYELDDKGTQYSSATKYLGELVELGQTLENILSGVRKIPSEIANMQSQLKESLEEEAHRRREGHTLRVNYKQDKQTLAQIQENLDYFLNYETLDPETHERLEDQIKSTSKVSPDINDPEVKELLQSYLMQTKIATEQLIKTRTSQMDIVATKLQSVRRQIESATKNQRQLWGIYNPTLKDLAKLHSAYTEMLRAKDRTIIQLDLQDSHARISDLIERARTIQELVDNEIDVGYDIAMASQEPVDPLEERFSELLGNSESQLLTEGDNASSNLEGELK